MTLRAAVIGCGRIGCGFDEDPRRTTVSTHAGAYVATEGVDLVALADVDRAKLDRYGPRFGVEALYEDYRVMLRELAPDIVSICTLSDSHREIVDAAAEAGVRAIFCEKPIADSLEAADEMIARCAGAGVLLVVDHQRRFDEMHREIAAYLDEGKLGAVQQATSYYTAGLANTGTHLFDLLRMFLGEVEWVEGLPSNAPSPLADDPNVDAWLQFASGARATVQALDVDAYTLFELSFLGTNGRLTVTGHGFEVRFQAAGESERFSGYRELHDATPPVSREGAPQFMLQAVQHLVNCVDGREQPISTGRDGRAALEIITALRESAATGGTRIVLPHKEARA